MAHIGPIVISAKKKASERQDIDMPILCVNINGMKDNIAMNMHIETNRLRARLRLPLRRSQRSLTTPPKVSPSTPAKNTAEANSADRGKSRLLSCKKYCGIQLKNSQSVQP